MKRIHFAAVAALAVAALAAAAHPAAAADGSYGVAQFSITNNTNITITYYVRWGTRTYPGSPDLGRWQTVALPPGYTQIHQRGLDARGRYVAPQIRFFTLDAEGVDVRRDFDLECFRVNYGMTGRTGSPRPYIFEASDSAAWDLFEP